MCVGTICNNRDRQFECDHKIFSDHVQRTLSFRDEHLNPYASPQTTAVYTVTVDGGNGCASKDSITITVNPQPQIQLRSDTAICFQTPIPLTLKSDPAATYSWSPAAGLSDPAIANPTAAPSATTLYTVTASNTYNCSIHSQVLLTVLQSPLATSTADTMICQGRTLSLSAGGGVSYIWSSSNGPINTTSPTLVVSPSVNTRYYVLVTGGNGCTGEDSTTVNVRPLPTFSVTPAYPAICRKEAISLTAAGGDLYSWTPGSGDFAGDGPLLRTAPTETQDYHVKITDSVCSINSILNVQLVVRELPVVDISRSNDINCTQRQAVLQASGGVYYAWDGDNWSLWHKTPMTAGMAPTAVRLNLRELISIRSGLSLPAGQCIEKG